MIKMAIRMEGKAVSEKLRQEIKEETAQMKDGGIVPGLAVVIVGSDPGSLIYVRNKKRACEECGITNFEFALPEETSQQQLLELIDRLNADERVDGILVQSPPPSHIDETAVIAAIRADKDVDAFNAANVGKIMIGDYDFKPCTPAGIMEMFKYYGIDPQGREAVVIGRSNIVGKPMAMLLLHANATVTICHSRTRDLAAAAKRADILVVAVGKPHFITADMVKPGAVVVDVGMNRSPDGKLCGDVDFETVEKVASCITPVPGGVGPMTITMLMKNTLKAARIHHRLD